MGSPDQARRGLKQVLFAVLLFAITLGMFVCGAFGTWANWNSVFDVAGSRRWVESSAYVQKITLTRTYQPKVGEIVRFQCTYSYLYEGNAFQSTTVGLDSDANRLGGPGDDLYNNLVDAAPKHEPVICFVNPERPQQAVLNRYVSCRKFAFGNLAGAFSLAGSVLTGLAFLWLTRPTLNEQFRASPQPYVVSPSFPIHRLLAATGVAWILGTAPVLVLPVVQASRPGDSMGLWLLLPLVGLGLLVWAVCSALQVRRFGRSTLLVEETPRMGGRLRCTVVLRGDMTGLHEIRLTCSCVAMGNSKARLQELWSESRDVPCITRFAQSEAAVDFECCLPVIKCNDTWPRPDDLSWELRVSGIAQGPGLNLVFPVRVACESHESIGVAATDR